MASLLGLRSAPASFNATNADWSLLAPAADLAACNLDDCGAPTDDMRPLSRLTATVAPLPATAPSLRSRRDGWLPVLDVLDVTNDAAVDLTTLNLLGFSACFICAWRCCGRAIRSGGMLSVVVVVAVCSWRAPVSDVDERGRSACEPDANDHGDVTVCVLLAGCWGRKLFVAAHVLRAAPLVVTSGTCGCVGPGGQLEASRTLSNLGIARFTGDVVGAVKFTALSKPNDSIHILYMTYARRYRSSQESCATAGRTARCRCKLRIEFCNDLMRFLCHSTAFLYMSASVQNAEITHSMLICMAVTQNDGDDQKSRHTTKITVKSRWRWIRDYLTALINVTI